MDDHPPSWEGNGSKYLFQFGLTSKCISRLNLFMAHAADDYPPPLDAVQIGKGLVENFSLKELQLHRCNVEIQGVTAIAQALSCNKFLQNIGLSRNRFGSTGGTHISEALSVNQTLHTVDLSWNELKDDFAASLAEALLVNNSLQRIILDKNRIGDDGVGALASALKGKHKVKYIGLSQNRLRAAGCSLLADTMRVRNGIVTLDLSMNGIQQEGLFSLFHALNSAVDASPLQTLNVAYNRVEGAITMLGQYLANTKSLRELNLERVLLQPNEALKEFAECLQNNRTLFNVSFATNELHDEGVAILCGALAAIPTLQYVDLTDCNATGDCVPSVAKFITASPRLTTLHLALNKLQGEDVGTTLGEAVAASAALRFINLSHCYLSFHTIESFCATLRLRQTKHHKWPLSQLVLRYNEFGEAGFVQLVYLLLHSEGFEYLDATGCDVGKEGSRQLNDAFECNKEMRCVVLDDATVITRDNASLDFDTELHKKQPPRKDLPYPLFCRARAELDASKAPTYGFSTYSIAVGSAMKRQLEGASHALPQLFQLAGKPVKGMDIFEGVRAEKSAPSLKGRSGTNFDHNVTFATTSRLESNIGGLLISDDQMRREFNKLDKNGNGVLDIDELKGAYRSFETFGIDYSDEQLTRMLGRYSSDGKITFDEFCVVMLQLVQQ